MRILLTNAGTTEHIATPRTTSDVVLISQASKSNMKITVYCSVTLDVVLLLDVREDIIHYTLYHGKIFRKVPTHVDYYGREISG